MLLLFQARQARLKVSQILSSQGFHSQNVQYQTIQSDFQVRYEILCRRLQEHLPRFHMLH